MLDERLLDILVCPSCREELVHKERRHVLVCTGCALQYPINDGIPIMLVDQAKKGRAVKKSP
ncbi:MAG: Trm112 family protein [Nitriliruptoraceae bacterium]